MRDKLIRLLQTILDDDSAVITDETLLMEDLALSSLEIMDMIASLEEEYDITIKERELQTIASFNDLLSLVEARVSQS